MTVQEVVKDCGWKRGCVAEWAGVVPATMVAHRTTEILQALHRFVSEVHCAVPQPAPGDPPLPNAHAHEEKYGWLARLKKSAVALACE